MKNEFNERLTGYIGGEKYEETICFNFDENDECENYTDLEVDAHKIKFSTECLTDFQIDEINEYAEEVQVDIRNAIDYGNDIIETENWLRNNFN